MLKYLHFVPGRLRLKVSELKYSCRAVEAEALISALPGVKSAVANSATGSLTINFNTDQLSISDLWERLRKEGYVSGRCPEWAAVGSKPAGYPGADRFGRAVINGFIEAVVQHSAQILVRALL